MVGEDPVVVQIAPRKYVWQARLDGQKWDDIEETAVEAERRMYRLHRLKSPRRLQYLRMKIDAAQGDFPALREIEAFADSAARVDFPEGIIAVSTIDRSEWEKKKGEGRHVLPLARSCPG